MTLLCSLLAGGNAAHAVGSAQSLPDMKLWLVRALWRQSAAGLALSGSPCAAGRTPQAPRIAPNAAPAQDCVVAARLGEAARCWAACAALTPRSSRAALRCTRGARTTCRARARRRSSSRRWSRCARCLRQQTRRASGSVRALGQTHCQPCSRGSTRAARAACDSRGGAASGSVRVSGQTHCRSCSRGSPRAARAACGSRGGMGLGFRALQWAQAHGHSAGYNRGAANHRLAYRRHCHARWHSTLQLLASFTPCLYSADPHASQNYRTCWPLQRHQRLEHIRAHSTLYMYLCIQSTPPDAVARSSGQSPGHSLHLMPFAPCTYACGGARLTFRRQQRRQITRTLARRGPEPWITESSLPITLCNANWARAHT